MCAGSGASHHVAAIIPEVGTRSSSGSNQPAADHDYLWEPSQVPKDADGRYWWTVLDCDGGLYLAAGFRFVNRFAYVRCANPWTEDDAATEYRYD